jgi:hypothetical protein
VPLELHHRDAECATSQEALVKAITLRNLPPDLTRIIRQKADEQHTSINKVVISLLEKSVGVRGRAKRPPASRTLAKQRMPLLGSY